MSLAVVNEGDVPDDKRVRLTAAHDALRLVSALAAEGRNDDAGRFYTEIGERVHDRGLDLEPSLVKEAAEAAGLVDLVGHIDDPSFDDAVRASTEAALADAGPGVGSPVLHVDGIGRGLHGPIIATDTVAAGGSRVADRGDDADDDLAAMWDAVATLMAQPHFFEVKRGRR